MTRPTEYHWVFGRNSHLEFPNGGLPVDQGTNTAPPLNTREGCASISDQNGVLLFYTDGRDLWNATGVQRNVDQNGNTIDLKGSPSSAHSAIIVPPPTGGTIYHVFCVMDWDNGSVPGHIFHSEFELAGNVTMINGPTPLSDSPAQVGEQLLSVPTDDCRGWWLLSVNRDDEKLNAILIDGDNGPSNTVQNSPYPKATPIFCAKASPNGAMLAFANGWGRRIDIFDFDRATGQTSNHRFFDHGASDDDNMPYGIEFSPDNRYVFYTRGGPSATDDHVYALDVATMAHSDLGSVNSGDELGALQLAPDNSRIYGVRKDAHLFTIETPNAGGGATLISIAQDSAGVDIRFDDDNSLSLPTFARFASDCLGGNCDALADDVNETLSDMTGDHHNALPHCDADDAQGLHPDMAVCTPLELPQIAPSYHITWGDSMCDGVESDDSEVMTLTICNPYSNVTLSHMMVHKLTVTQANGDPVAILPDETDSVTLVPIGPYCFGDIAPCSCVSRAFTLRNRGAKAGSYKIHLSGICFDVCLHQDARSCFAFEICKD